MIEVVAVDSPVSLLWVAHDEGTIVASTLAGSTHSPTFTPYLDLPLAEKPPTGLVKAIAQAFTHKGTSGLPFDHRIGTDFQRLVWKNCALIPFGETSTYQELAHAIGRPKATRAVGTALGANPFLVLIPCHRVLRADGSLGGFAAGLEAKARLLACEKASTS